MLAWKNNGDEHRRRTCRCSHQLIGPIREEANTRQTSDATIITNAEDPA